MRQGNRVIVAVLVCGTVLAARGGYAGAANQDCVNDGSGFYTNAHGNFEIQGGQISGAGATLFVDFFRAPSSTNDWNDVDNDGFAGFDPFTFPFVDQLATTFVPTQDLTTWWAFQYRSVGSVNGFNEFVQNQLCHTIPTSVPGEAGLFNGLEYATAGLTQWAGPFDNDSGTPLEPCEIEFAFLDVPSVWAVQVPGTPNWNRTPLDAGYGLNPIASSTGYVSNLQPLFRDCGAGNVFLNQNFGSPDGDTIYDFIGAWVPVAYVANRGAGVENVTYSQMQYLFTTGRMPDGENLVAVTRSVGSGTRNAIMNSTGIDTSWGRGDNVGNEVASSTPFNLGPGTQQTNGQGSSQVETAFEAWRLAVGYTGLAGPSRAASDAAAGRYEVLNLCKDVAGVDCSTPPTNYVRPTINSVLDNCDPATGYQIGGNGSFVTRGDPDANRDPLDPKYDAANPPLDNTSVADYINNMADSIDSFVGDVFAGECNDTEVCTVKRCAGDNAVCTGSGNGNCAAGQGPCNLIACESDGDCSAGSNGTCVLKSCTNDSTCTDQVCSVTGNTCTSTSPDCDDVCVSNSCTLSAAACDSDPDCPGFGQVCRGDFCKSKLNMPGQYLATTFFLPIGIDCQQGLSDGTVFSPTLALNQPLQDYIRANNGLGIGQDTPAFGSVNPAGRVPKRNSVPAPGYSDGSTTGSYTYWNGAGYTSNLAAGQNLSQRNRLQGDFNEDGVRDINDAAQLVAAYKAPRAWQQTAVANGSGALGNQTRDNAIPEVLGDFDGNGNLDHHDLRYFADGLAMVPSGGGKVLNRKQGAMAIDAALTSATAHPYPWAETGQVIVPAAAPGSEPTFNTPKDVNDVVAPFLKTGKLYEPGDFRGDVAGANPVAGAQPLGWDGFVDDRDIDYCFSKLGDWSNLDEAVNMDLSCDMDGIGVAAGSRAVDNADIDELVRVILGTEYGDANLDRAVDAADTCIVLGTLANPASCNSTQTCGWADGDFNGDRIVDILDAAFVPPPDAPAAAPAPYDVRKNRYVSFTPAPCALPIAYAIERTFPPLPVTYYVGAPDANGMAQVVPAPVFRVWTEPVVHVGDCEIHPVPDTAAGPFACSISGAPCAQVCGSGQCPPGQGECIPPPTTYEIRQTDGTILLGTPLAVTTVPRPCPKRWGDTVGDFSGGAWTPPNGTMNVNDFVAALQKFQSLPQAPHVTVVDVVGAGLPGQEACLNRVGNVSDVFNLIKAFQGQPYPFTTDPPQCPVCP